MDRTVTIASNTQPMKRTPGPPGMLSLAPCMMLMTALSCTATFAETYTVDANADLVGRLRSVQTEADKSLVDVARQYDHGFNEIKSANAHLNVWLPGEDQAVLLPSLFVLPDGPREGIVLNLAELRLYHYQPSPDPNRINVSTYPVGIGREGWETPVLTTSISDKKKHPAWVVPASIQAEHLAKGDPLPDVVPPGPNNPLGEYALRLGGSSYLIHGTNKPGGIGMRVSHGCIRLYPEDIERLFSQVEVGTPVRIIEQSTKAGLQDGKLYLEVHPPAAADVTPDALLKTATERLTAAALGRTVTVDWKRVRKVLAEANGIPAPVGEVGPIDRRKSWTLIAGSFDAQDAARSLAARIADAQLDSRTWKIADRYQVEVGPFADVQQADYARRLIRKRTGILALKIPPS